MPEELRTTQRQLTGDDIIAEIVRNSEAGLFKIRHTTLVPCVYHVYLHPGDYDTVRPVIPALTAEARTALIEHMEELNRKGKPSQVAKYLGFDSGTAAEYKILDADWTIEFHPDMEEKLERGDLEIHSELASAAKPEFEGAMTRQVTRRRPDGETSSSSDATTRISSASNAEIFGTIRYKDSKGSNSYSIITNQVVIGRGGPSFWVDIQLSAPPDVSREHCRIRRDPASGRFYIKDVSQFGTSVDGKRIPSSIEDKNGQTRDANVEVPLPPNAKIILADVITLEFESAGAK